MTNIRNKAPLGEGLIVISSLFYASYGIWTRLTSDFINGYPATALRSVIVVLILFPIAIYFRKLEKLNLKANWPTLVCLTFSSVIIWGPLYYAVTHAGIGVSLAVSYAAIVLGLFFFGWLLFKEKMTFHKVLSCVLGFVGLGLIFLPGNSSFGWLALGAAALSGLGSSFNMILSRKLTYNPTQSTILLWTTGIIANTAMIFIAHEHVPRINISLDWLYLLIFGFVSVAASWTFVVGLRRVDAGLAGILGLLEIVFGIAFGVIIFHERPGAWVYSGAAVIMLAAAVPYLHGLDLKRGRLK